MQSAINVIKKVNLRKPVMIEGLPGVGFVANLSAIYLIKKLRAEKFAEIHSPHFQDFAVSSSDGTSRLPVNELYFWKSEKGERDVIILYGNTQALTVFGQYELSGRILDFVQGLGCNSIICLGGLKREKLEGPPQLFGTFTDLETLREASQYGLGLMQGRIFGMAGVLLGLASLRKMRGFCLLVETLGVYPDGEAAKEVLEFLARFLGLSIDLGELEEAAKDAAKVLEFLEVIESKRMEEFSSRF